MKHAKRKEQTQSAKCVFLLSSNQPTNQSPYRVKERVKATVKSKVERRTSGQGTTQPPSYRTHNHTEGKKKKEKKTIAKVENENSKTFTPKKKSNR